MSTEAAETIDPRMIAIELGNIQVLLGEIGILTRFTQIPEKTLQDLQRLGDEVQKGLKPDDSPPWENDEMQNIDQKRALLGIMARVKVIIDIIGWGDLPNLQSFIQDLAPIIHQDSRLKE